MARIIHIETATTVCSACIAENGELIAVKEINQPNAHGKKLTVFIEELLLQHKRSMDSIDAICVSKGPGSYTGLRIGVATAKGLCYGSNLPLLSINTLKAMANGYIQNHLKHGDNTLLCPMIDARRMEVYTALYDTNLKEVEATQAKILDENSFAEYLKNHKIIFFGDGAFKCKDLFSSAEASVDDTFLLSSAYLVSLAYEKFQSKEFENLAYFEPYYLKEFVATTPKKNILRKLTEK